MASAEIAPYAYFVSNEYQGVFRDIGGTLRLVQPDQLARILDPEHYPLLWKARALTTSSIACASIAERSTTSLGRLGYSLGLPRGGADISTILAIPNVILERERQATLGLDRLARRLRGGQSQRAGDVALRRLDLGAFTGRLDERAQLECLPQRHDGWLVLIGHAGCQLRPRRAAHVLGDVLVQAPQRREDVACVDVGHESTTSTRRRRRPAPGKLRAVPLSTTLMGSPKTGDPGARSVCSTSKMPAASSAASPVTAPSTVS